MRKPPPPALRDQLITIPVMMAGMVLFVWLSTYGKDGAGRDLWWGLLLRLAGWACAIVGSATIFAVLGRVFNAGTTQKPDQSASRSAPKNSAPE